MTSGLLVVDKPGGITSHGVVAIVRRATGIKKAGHAGTLDPLATGVLVVALGQATRLVRYVQDGAKEYVATIQFGIATDSLDADGVETERAPMSFSVDDLRQTLEKFKGELVQVPPMVSALKVRGKRLYDLARAGQEIVREPRQVSITELELTDFDPQPEFPIGTIRVVSSKGTYIRTLADDIARDLGGRAHLIGLRRTRVGPFGLENAASLDDLAEWHGHLLPPSEAVSELSKWFVTDDEAESISHGRALSAPDEGGPWAMLGSGDELMGVYRRDGVQAVAEVVLS